MPFSRFDLSQFPRIQAAKNSQTPTETLATQANFEFVFSWLSASFGRIRGKNLRAQVCRKPLYSQGNLPLERLNTGRYILPMSILDETASS